MSPIILGRIRLIANVKPINLTHGPRERIANPSIYSSFIFTYKKFSSIRPPLSKKNKIFDVWIQKDISPFFIFGDVIHFLIIGLKTTLILVIVKISEISDC